MELWLKLYKESMLSNCHSDGIEVLTLWDSDGNVLLGLPIVHIYVSKDLC